MVMLIPNVSNVESDEITIDIGLTSDYWNFKSYPNITATDSPTLFNEIENCTALVGKHNTTGYWHTYWPLIGLLENWTIYPGDGLFILTNSDTYWTTTISVNATGNGSVESFTRGYTVVIASNETSQARKNESDYVCDGYNDDLIINGAIQNITRGTIKLLYGYYNISNPIVIDRFVNIVGDGVGSSVIYLEDGSNCGMIEYNLSSEYTRGPLMYLAHFMLKGNKNGQTSGTSAINTMAGELQVKDWYMYDVWIDSYRGNGTYIRSTHNWLIEHTAIERCSGAGIYCDYAQEGTIFSNLIYDCQVGIRLNDMNWPVTILSNRIDVSEQQGIYISSGANHRVAYNEITGSNKDAGSYDGVQCSNFREGIITGNFIDSSDQRYGIAILGSTSGRNKVSENIIWDCDTGGIWVQGNCQNNTICDNTFYNLPLAVLDGGVNTRIYNNVGLETEQYGTTSSGTEIQINHNLSGTPDYVILTPLGNTSYFYVHSKTATTFNITSEKSVAFNWYAIYKP